MYDILLKNLPLQSQKASEMNKKENKRRALQAVELLHKAFEKSDPFHDYSSYIEDDPKRFVEVHGTWLASYCMLCSSESQEELLSEARILQEQQKHILESMAEESRKASKTSRWISIISLVLAGVAICSSVAVIYYSYSWQKEQIALLKRIVDNTQQDKESISK